jgi:uncharacterized protein
MNVITASDGRLRSGWRFVLAALLAYLANVLAASFAASAGSGRLFELIYRWLALLFVLGAFSLLLVTVDRIDSKPLAAMGLALRKPWLRDIGKGLLLGFAMIALGVGVLAVCTDFNTRVTLSSRSFKLLIVELATLASGAMLEEAMFRGYPFQRLLESAGAMGGVAISSALFGAVHFANPDASLRGFLNTTAMGVLFCLAYLRTRSLWMPWAIHFAWNVSLGVIFGLPVSGITAFSVVVRSRAVGPQWLTGGSYGIEAGALGTAVIVLGILAVVLFVDQRAADPQLTAVEADWPNGRDGNAAERIQL